MKTNFQAFIYFLILNIVSIPSFLKAQGNHDGNHCTVQKSPYRLSLDSGKKVYVQLCQSCHQPGGSGRPDVNPPLTGKRITGDKNKMILLVIRGMSATETLDGKTYPKGMPPNEDMKDQDIADVLTYIRNSFGNRASAVKASEVKSTRSKLN